MSSVSSTPSGGKLIWDSGVPRDYLPGPDVRFATCWVLWVGLQRDV